MLHDNVKQKGQPMISGHFSLVREATLSIPQDQKKETLTLVGRIDGLIVQDGFFLGSRRGSVHHLSHCHYKYISINASIFNV